MKMGYSINMRATLKYAVMTISIVVLLSGCISGEPKSAEEWFNVSWSGMAGKDELTIQGEAVLLRGKQLVVENNMSYSGKLSNHTELALKADLPTTVSTKPSSPKKEIKLQWEGGRWNIDMNSANNAEVIGLTRMNPLDQLKDIRYATKTMSLENASARGTKGLRIEIDPIVAKEQLHDKLDREMKELKSKWTNQIAGLNEGSRQQVEQQIEEIWKAGNDQLNHMLDQADTKVIYHLTIDQNTSLPVRLTSETELNYVNLKGINEHEVLLSDNRFSNYQ